jgi:class 3 adenylate cyclase
MIFFGAPVPLEDREQTLRAVRMGQERQERMVALRTAWLRRGFEDPFEIRIGINTGQASIGNFGY